MLVRSSLATYTYVDDTTLVEITGNQPVRHVTGTDPTESLWADFTEAALQCIVTRSTEISMSVNCSKTQMLCVSPANGYRTSAHITIQGEQIWSGDAMKLLGFTLAGDAGMQRQVDMIKNKFRARFWSLIHLRRAGIRGMRLFSLYSTLVRPILEVNAVIFHPMLTVAQSDSLERLQKQVVGLCFGFNVSYNRALEDNAVDTLKERRTKALRRFTAKAMSNTRFKYRWFVHRQESNTELRRRRPYIEKRARTERYRRSPLLTIQRIANDIATANA